MRRCGFRYGPRICQGCCSWHPGGGIEGGGVFFTLHLIREALGWPLPPPTTTIWIRGTNYRRTNFAGDAKRTIRDKSTYAISDAPSYYRALSPITIFLHGWDYCNCCNEQWSKVYLIYCRIGGNWEGGPACNGKYQHLLDCQNSWSNPLILLTC